MTVRKTRPRWLKAVDMKGGGVLMTDDPDKAAALFAEIATEQQVIDQLAEGTERLRAIQQAKRDLAQLEPSALRAALGRRHASLVEGA